jgi:hypothetical protein
LWIHGLGLLWGYVEKLIVELVQPLVQEVSITCICLPRVSSWSYGTSERRETYSALVGSKRMVECVYVEAVLGHLSLEVFFLSKGFPQLGSVAGSRKPTRHAYDDTGVGSGSNSIVEVFRWD